MRLRAVEDARHRLLQSIQALVASPRAAIGHTSAKAAAEARASATKPILHAGLMLRLGGHAQARICSALYKVTPEVWFMLG